MTNHPNRAKPTRGDFRPAARVGKPAPATILAHLGSNFHVMACASMADAKVAAARMIADRHPAKDALNVYDDGTLYEWTTTRGTPCSARLVETPIGQLVPTLQ